MVPKALAKLPSYMRGGEARKAKSGGKATHPDYFSPLPDVDYWLALLPAHKNNPPDEDGNPSPFVVIYKYYGGYRTPAGDVRNNPIAAPVVWETGNDPLYARHLSLNESDDKEESYLGWRLRPQPRILMNVHVVASREKGGIIKKDKELGDLYKRPLIFELPAGTFNEKFEPMFQSDDFEGDGGFFDLFGQFNEEVPLIKVKKIKKGEKAYEIEWSLKRTDTWRASATSKRFAKLRTRVIDLLAHETTQPHTVEELNVIYSLSVSVDLKKGKRANTEIEDVDFSDSDDDDEDEDFLSDNAAAVAEKDDSDDDIEEEEDAKPKKKKKKAKPEPEPAPKKKKKKKAKPTPEPEEDDDDDDDVEFSKEDSAYDADEEEDDDDEEEEFE